MTAPGIGSDVERNSNSRTEPMDLAPVAPPTLRQIFGAIWPILLACGSLLSFLVLMYPPLASGDETAHMDYAWQVWHGSLPDFYEGLKFDPGFGQWPPMQWEAQHPPLFYLLTAPILGPFIDAGHPLRAVLVGRFLNVGITLLLLTALAWAVTRIVGGRRPLVWAVVTTTFAAVISPLLRTGSTFYNDMLAVTATTVALGIVAIALRRGPTITLVLAAAAASTVAIGIRANSVLVVLVVAAGLTVATWRGTERKGRGRWGVAAAAGLAPLVAAVAAFGWFYVRNIRITGTWQGSYMDWFIENMNREVVSYWSVIKRFGSWVADPFFVLQRIAPAYAGANAWSQRVAQVMLVVGVLAGCWLLGRRLKRLDSQQRVTELLVLGLCTAQLVGTIAMFVVYVQGGGGYNARYFLPALLPFALLFACGVLVLPRRGQTIGMLVALALCLPALCHWIYQIQSKLGWGLDDSAVTGVPMIVMWILLVVAGLGLLGSVWKLRQTGAETRSAVPVQPFDLDGEPDAAVPTGAGRDGDG